MDLTFVYLAIFSFFPRLGLGPSNSCSIDFIDKVLMVLNPSRVLVALDRLGIICNTRQAKHDSTTVGPAKLVGIELEVAGLAHNELHP